MATELECPLCMEVYDLHTREPKVLPCGGAHQICSFCALRLRPTGSDQSFTCPTCREYIPSGLRINTNRGLITALEMRTAQLQEADRLTHELERVRAEITQAQDAAREAAARVEAAAREPTASLQGRPPQRHRKLGRVNRGARQQVMKGLGGNESSDLRRKEAQFMFLAALIALTLIAWSYSQAGHALASKALAASKNSPALQRSEDGEVKEDGSFPSAADIERDFGMKEKEFHDLINSDSKFYIELHEDKWYQPALLHPDSKSELQRKMKTELDDTTRDPYGDGVQTVLPALPGGGISDLGNALFKIWPDADLANLLVQPKRLPVIHRLCLEGRAEKIRNLLAADSDPMVRKRHLERRIGLMRWTPLMLATAAPMLITSPAEARAYIKVVQILLEEGARPDAKDLAGFTALHLAADFATPASPASMMMLLKSGADPNVQNRFGETPLWRAFARLLKCDEKDNVYGNSLVPRQPSVRLAHVPMLSSFCNLLIMQGADLDIATITGRSVRRYIDVVTENGNNAMLNRLIDTANRRDNLMAHGILHRTNV